MIKNLTFEKGLLQLLLGRRCQKMSQVNNTFSKTLKYEHKDCLTSQNIKFNFSTQNKKTQPYPKVRPSSKQLKEQQKFKPKSHQKSLTDPQLYIQMINNKANITDAVKLLNKIMNNSKISKQEFQKKVWKKYSYYICLVGEKEEEKMKNSLNNPNNSEIAPQNHFSQQQMGDHQQLNKKEVKNSQTLIDNHKEARFQKQKKLRLKFLDLITSVHQKFKGQLTSQHLTKIYNKFVDAFLQKQEWKKLYCHQKVSVLQSLSRYNIKKAYTIFLKRKNHIYSSKKQLTHPNDIISLLKLMINIDVIDTQMFEEIVIENLYDQIQLLDLAKLQEVSLWLGKSHKFVNKDFFTKLIKRFSASTTGETTNETDRIRMLHVLSSFTMIQKNMGLSSVWFQPLDPVYQRLFPFLNSVKLSTYKSKYLNMIASSLKRCQFYDQSILKNLVNQCIKRQVVQFQSFQNNQFQSKNQKPNEFNSINLPQLTQVFFTLASFNFRNVQFVNYFLNLLQLIQNSGHPYEKYISNYSLFSRLLWSLCVLCTQKQMDSLLPLIQYFYRKSQKIEAYDATNFYYCYLLLKTRYPNSQIRWQNDKVQQYLQGPKHQIQISQIQKQIHHYLIESGVPALLQYNLNNVICDIYIPKFYEMQHLIIEVHGFHHFARNIKILNGSTALKQKIIENEGYFCFYISIDQWLIAENKKQFIQDFMEFIVRKKYDQKLKKKQQKQNMMKIDQKVKYLHNQNNLKIKQRQKLQRQLLEGNQQRSQKKFGRRVKRIQLIE